jgi:hypothetical protein
MQDASKDVVLVYEPWYPPNMFIRASGCGMSDMSITWSANKGENIAQRVYVERIYYITILPRGHVDVAMALSEAVTWP